MASVKVAVRVRPLNQRSVSFFWRYILKFKAFIQAYVWTEFSQYRENERAASLIIEMEGKKTKISNFKVSLVKYRVVGSAGKFLWQWTWFRFLMLVFFKFRQALWRKLKSLHSTIRIGQQINAAEITRTKKWYNF